MQKNTCVLKTIAFEVLNSGAIVYDGPEISWYNFYGVKPGKYYALVKPMANGKWDAILYWKQDEEHHTFGNFLSL